MRATASAKDGKLAGSPRWRWRYAESRLSIDDAIFTGVEDALRRIADAQPGEAREIVDPLASTDFHELRFLACRTYAAAQPGNEAIEWLLADDRNLALGWADSPRWASRELIEAASGSCDDDSLHRLNERLLDYYPDRERSAEGRRSHGYAQYELLSTIPRARLCEAAAKRLAELERKFVGHPPEPPQSIEVKTVDSPIERPAAERLSDADWLRAIAKHRRDRLDWSGGVPIGGAAELANVVRERAEAEPDRFARLALQLDEASSPVYLCRIIEAVAGRIPVPDLEALCRHARAVAGHAVGRPICHAIGTVSGEATDVLVELLQDCAGDDDPTSEVARTRSERGDFYFGGDLTMAGLNCTRGEAARALARVLNGLPQLADQLMPTLIRLALDPILAVRTMAADAVHVLMNTQREIALELAYGLFDGLPVDVFNARSTRLLLRGSLLRQPERFAPFLHQALDGPESVAEGAGSVWAAALVQDLLRPPLTTDLTALCAPARRGAATLLAADPSVSPDLVVQLFDDDDESVRSAFASAVRTINDLDAATAQLIVSACTASAAFAESFDDLFPVLREYADPA